MFDIHELNRREAEKLEPMYVVGQLVIHPSIGWIKGFVHIFMFPSQVNLLTLVIPQLSV